MFAAGRPANGRLMAKSPAIRPLTQRTLLLAVQELGSCDADLAGIHATAGVPPLRARAPGFATLLKIICAQQVSTASARSIVARLDSAFDPLSPAAVAQGGAEALRAIGFSRQKAEYGIGLARAVLAGDLELAAVARLSDEDAIAQLSALKGIGRWTAEIYLLFALRRPDLWPVDDLAIVSAVQRLKGMAERPSRIDMQAIGESWRPWRSVAARLLWHFYNTLPLKAG